MKLKSPLKLHIRLHGCIVTTKYEVDLLDVFISDIKTVLLEIVFQRRNNVNVNLAYPQIFSSISHQIASQETFVHLQKDSLIHQMPVSPLTKPAYKISLPFLLSLCLNAFMDTFHFFFFHFYFFCYIRLCADKLNLQTNLP